MRLLPTWPSRGDEGGRALTGGSYCSTRSLSCRRREREGKRVVGAPPPPGRAAVSSFNFASSAAAYFCLPPSSSFSFLLLIRRREEPGKREREIDCLIICPARTTKTRGLGCQIPYLAASQPARVQFKLLLTLNNLNIRARCRQTDK